jgi:uncharacterized membrane protein
MQPEILSCIRDICRHTEAFFDLSNYIILYYIILLIAWYYKIKTVRLRIYCLNFHAICSHILTFFKKRIFFH